MRVLLIQMPFFTLDTASISLSLVKAALDRAGFSCDIRYLNLELGKRFGTELYTWIAGNSPPYLLLGDLLFADSLHGRAVTPEELRALAAPLQTPGVPVVPANVLAAFPGLVAAASRFIEEQAHAVPWAEYDLVGFNTMFQIAPVLAMVARIKQLPKAPRIVLGGSYCEAPMGEQLCASFPAVDYACCGEGEELIVALARHLSGDSVQLQDVPGLVFRQDGQVLLGRAPERGREPSVLPGKQLVRVRGDAPRSDPDAAELDRLPIPRYDDWLAQIRGAALLPDDELRLPLETSRGCWWGQVQHCTFCGLNGAVMAYRRKSPERALLEVRALCEYGVRRLHAVDDILDHRYFKSLLPQLVELRHDVQIFYEIKSNVSYEQARLLADSGIRWVQPGIESLSSAVLKLMKKGVSALQNVRLLRWGAELGIGLMWNLLYGFPGEDPAEFDAIAALVPAISHLQPPYIEVCQVRLHRYSPLFEHSAQQGLRDVVPARAYSVIFPFEPAAVARLAYYFDHRYVDHPDPNSYIAGLTRAVRGWHGEVGRAVFIRMQRGDSLRLFDTRAIARVQSALLTGLERDVYLAAEAGVALESIAEQLGRSTAEVAEVVQPMLDKRWLVELDGKLLALAVPIDEQMPSHVPGPLAESMLAERQRAQMRAFAGSIRPPLPSLATFEEHVANASAEPA